MEHRVPMTKEHYHLQYFSRQQLRGNRMVSPLLIYHTWKQISRLVSHIRGFRNCARMCGFEQFGLARYGWRGFDFTHHISSSLARTLDA